MSGGQLWSGGFRDAPDPRLWSYTASTVDRRLWPEDIAASRAHVHALVRAGVLDQGQAEALRSGLAVVAKELAAGTFVWQPGDEDVHTAVERRLTELLGPLGRTLHTARSRNDQVATDVQLWCKRALADMADAVADLVAALAERGQTAVDAVVPALTHLQPAQPVPWGFQLAAHGVAFVRDLERLADAGRRADVCPLGAGAVAGSSFELDPEETARELGFAASFANAMDATSQRDAVADVLNAGALVMVHASRLAEDVVLWAGWGWVRLPDAWATGSSMLPQKRNPDVAELVRGRTGTVLGRLMGFLATLKGLPTAYGRDLQEDKGVAFEVADTVTASAQALAGLVAALVPDLEVMARAAASGETTAIDLADQLVRTGVPFREAHEAVGHAVRAATSAGRPVAALTSEELVAAHPALARADLSVLNVEAAISGRASRGGSAPKRVAEQLHWVSGRAQAARAWAAEFRPRLDLG